MKNPKTLSLEKQGWNVGCQRMKVGRSRNIWSKGPNFQLKEMNNIKKLRYRIVTIVNKILYA
jgi:hypothetical protein